MTRSWKFEDIKADTIDRVESEGSARGNGIAYGVPYLEVGRGISLETEKCHIERIPGGCVAHLKYIENVDET